MIEYLIDVSIVKDIHEENELLKLKLEEAERVDHIEIINRVEYAEPKDVETLDFPR